jgi:hypothetical protein
MLPIIKNFKGEAQTNLILGIEVEEFVISWDYISFIDGTEIGVYTFSVLNTLLTQEFILCWDLVLNQEYYATIDESLPTDKIPLAWYTDTYFLEYYFYSSNSIWPNNTVELNIPKVYNQKQGLVPLKPNVNFISNGKNYPGTSLSTGQLISKYPGIIPGYNSSAEQPSSITENLTGYFLENISEAEALVRQSWNLFFGPSTGTEYSAYLFGLNRDDYSFKDLVPSLLKSLVYKIVNNTVAYDTVYLTKINNYAVRSLNSLSDFKYGTTVNIPADIGLKCITPNAEPLTVYEANNVEGSTIIEGNTGLIINLLPERYEPLIVLEQIINANEFVRGFKYKTLIGQIFPAGYISTNSTEGRFPAAGINEAYLTNIKLFEGKNTEQVINFLFKLFKLRLGKSYDTNADIINTGPEDFSPLVLKSWKPLTADFIAGDIVGDETNLLTVRLPFSYKRDSLEWALVHQICQAFLFNYTIGYHEFVADFSVAGEPVNSINPVLAPTVYLDVCSLFYARTNYSVSFNTQPNINLPESKSFNTQPNINLPESKSYNALNP